jgi:hypothetical protein
MLSILKGWIFSVKCFSICLFVHAVIGGSSRPTIFEQRKKPVTQILGTRNSDHSGFSNEKNLIGRLDPPITVRTNGEKLNDENPSFRDWDDWTLTFDPWHTYRYGYFLQTWSGKCFTLHCRFLNRSSSLSAKFQLNHRLEAKVDHFVVVVLFRLLFHFFVSFCLFASYALLRLFSTFSPRPTPPTFYFPVSCRTWF